ncbi:MAG: hypothetical protein ACK5RJ_12840 [Burkholderiales bacterium]|jgi:hypothetical protein
MKFSATTPQLAASSYGRVLLRVLPLLCASLLPLGLLLALPAQK